MKLIICTNCGMNFFFLLFGFLLYPEANAKVVRQGDCNFDFDVSGEQENYFNSPGFPVPGYTNNLECTYKFHAPVGSKVKVEFLQGTTERCCDKVEAISEGSLGFYSFSLDHREVISRKNNLTLIFRTDKSVTLRGFNASYRLIQDHTTTVISTTTPTTAPAIVELPDCNFTFNVIGDEENYFSSPGFPTPGYMHHLECNYRFTAATGSIIKITFVEGKTEECCDIIETNSEGSPSFYGGILDGREIVSLDNTLTLVFRTDHSVKFKGFNASFRAQAIICDPSRISPTNGEVSCTKTNRVGSICTYTCNEGYILSDNNLSNTVCNDDGDDDTDGEWSLEPPECIAITCDPSRTAPTNGEVSCTKTNHHGSICTYTCNEGYILSDNSLSNTTCNDDGDNDADGEWSSSPPECIAITCDPSRTAPTNGVVSCTNTNLVGSVCTYICNEGYNLSINSQYTTCNDDGDDNADGEWSSSPPECIVTYDICDEDEISGERGYLTSLPGDYFSNIDCSKIISSPPGKRVEISFLMMDIQQDVEYCRFGSLTVTVGDQTYSGASYCGNQEANDFTTEKDVGFTFKTDNMTLQQGFQIYWEMVDDCKKGFFRCWDGSCIPLSKICDGISDCPQNNDEIECARDPSFYGECGKNSAAAEFTWDPRIVGGSRAKSNSYPWTVPLYYYGKVDTFSDDVIPIFFCAATIISDRWLLTAAHCTIWAPERPGDLFGLLGTDDKTDFNSTKVYFDRVIVHPEYYKNTTSNDIALLRTNESIMFDDAVRSVCIPYQEYSSIDDETCITVGWGDLYFNYQGNAVDLLRQVRVKIVDKLSCQSTYSGTVEITNNHTCAGDLQKGGRDACQDDSGGPLLCLKDNSWFQFGITSSGGECGQAKSPGIYTDVRSYFNWIQQESSLDQTIDICGGKNIRGESGYVISPNFPDPYGYNLTCSKTISPPSTKRVNINFVKMDIEQEADGCKFDNLSVIIGDELYTGIPFCGNHDPLNFTTENEVKLIFKSDYGTSRSGFKIQWEMIDDCDEEQFRCGNGLCIPSSKHCDGVTDCEDKSDENRCVHPTSFPGQCGKNSVARNYALWQPKIVGGKEAVSNSWPWVVPLISRDHKFFCGATIIMDNWLVTAAHCLTDAADVSDMYGLLGTNNRTDLNSAKVTFQHMIVHPEYDTRTHRNDIALLQTSEIIQFNDKVNRVCIKDQDAQFEVKEECWAVGWGKMSYGHSEVPELLREVNLNLYSKSECKNFYDDDAKLMNKRICAGNRRAGGRDTCQGDSGGPLLCFKDGSWIQLGVTSVGKNDCGDAKAPGVYTDVRKYHGWITRATKKRTNQQENNAQAIP